METLELFTLFFGSAITLATVLISAFFSQRVHHLERRVDELEAELEAEWHYQRRLIDAIYRLDGDPPEKTKP